MFLDKFILNEKINKNTAQLSDIVNLLNPNIELKSICTTIVSGTTNANMDSWVTAMSGIDCTAQVVVMETISTSAGIDFTSATDMEIKIVYFKNALALQGKHISMIKPHIGDITSGDGFDRPDYLPTDIPGFFTNWKAKLLNYARICNANSIDILCLSCEQNSTTVLMYLSYWIDIINSIKALYPNLKLLCAYTTTEIKRDMIYKQAGTACLVDYLDMVGINMYPTLLKTEVTTNICSYFDFLYSSVKYLWGDLGIVITETGCSYYTDSYATTIYPIYLLGPVDYTSQRTFLDADLNYIFNNVSISGVCLWHMNGPFACLDDVACKNTIVKYFGGEQ